MVVLIDVHGHDGSLQLAQIAVGWPNLAVLQVELPGPHTKLSSGYQRKVVVPEELHNIRWIVGSGRTADCLARRQVPNDQGIVVLATQRSQPPFVARECHRLHLNLVQTHSVQDLHALQVPHDHIRLKTHMGALARCKVPSGRRQRDARYAVRVSLKETLCLRVCDLAHHHSGTQRENHSLLVWHQNKTLRDRASKPNAADKVKPLDLTSTILSVRHCVQNFWLLRKGDGMC
mmetsp:Transcript_30408/g.70137  ORF Transcript_30408/g.70137 Transcript_30408/m.70137 type:complete len:232 (-) Transcript_30408:61-756(-)